MTEALWIFGYGSLIWDPGFAVAERVVARVTGWHRSFCMHSIHHRGTPEKMGLVLALDRAERAFCDGVALRVASGTEAATMMSLRERELISSAYLEERLAMQTRDGRSLMAVTYVVDPGHVQYCRLSLAEQAPIIAEAVGGRGANRDYLYATAAHLGTLGISDADLDLLVTMVREIAG